MSIIQISKIQQRSGNLVDLPQLDNAQFGFASDAKLLFIGAPASSTTGNINENVEVLTAYSTISLSQIKNSDGSNLNILNAEEGQVLTFNSSSNTWYNAGANLGGLINLGTASNVKISGGSSGYVLETDGLGNLGWTPKGAIIAPIKDISRSNPGVITTQTANPYTNGLAVTLSNILDDSFGNNLNGNTFYVKVKTSDSFELFTDSTLTTPVNTVSYSGNYSANTGRVASSLTSGGGSGASGSNTTVQYNKGGTLAGSGDFIFDDSSKRLVVNGNIQGLNYFSANYFDTTGNSSLRFNSTSATISISNQPNIAVITTTGANLLGALSVSGNAVLGNLNTNNIISNSLLSNSANINGILSVTGNTITDNIISNSANVSGSIMADNLLISNAASINGNITVGNITSNIGLFNAITALTIGNRNSTITGNGFALSSIPAANLSGQINLSTQVTNILPVDKGGTGQTTITSAINSLLPPQENNQGKVLSTNGTNISWDNTAIETLVKNLINTIEPIGTIKAWAGAIANIPTGWALCNGRNGTLNLTDRFIAGFGGNSITGNGIYAQNEIRGTPASTFSTTGSINGTTNENGWHQHVGRTADHALSWNEMPPHTHAPSTGSYVIADGGQILGLATNNNGLRYYLGGGVGWAGSGWGHGHNFTTNGAGGHTHTFSSTVTVPVPAFFALAFIQKIANIS